MFDPDAALGSRSFHASDHRRRARHRLALMYIAALGVTIALAGLAAVSAPKPLSIAAMVLLGGAAIGIARPVIGIYLTVFLAIVGDTVTMPWYPFTKGFSSPESILFVSRSIIINPFELYLVALYLGWLIQRVAPDRPPLARTTLMKPALVFIGFLVVGLAHGLSSGGDKNVALWEIRPILYLPLVFFLVVNVLSDRRQYERLYIAVMAGITVNAVAALIYRNSLSKAEQLALEALGQHDAALLINVLFVMLAAGAMFKGLSRRTRRLLTVMLVPVAPAYLYAQRRAAFVGLVAGVILLGIVLLWKNRRQFMRVVPIIGVVFVAYVGVFWNSSGSLGFPAQAVKSVVAPSQLNARDQSSDQYRVIEHVDVLSTIKANKLLGVGFGQPFYRPIPLPNITVFLLADYMSHNSLLWIWMKAGVFGFLAMLYLFGSAIRTGGRAIRASTDTTDVVLTITSTAFIVMYGVFTYVDISWDAKTMILMAIAFSQIDATIRKVVVEPARRRRARAAADPVLVALSSK